MDGIIQTDDDFWTVAGRRFRSRLVVGTGKYKDLQETAAAIVDLYRDHRLKFIAD